MQTPLFWDPSASALWNLFVNNKKSVVFISRHKFLHLIPSSISCWEKGVREWLCEGLAASSGQPTTIKNIQKEKSPKHFRWQGNDHFKLCQISIFTVMNPEKSCKVRLLKIIINCYKEIPLFQIYLLAELSWNKSIISHTQDITNPFKCFVQRLKPSFQTNGSLHFPQPIPPSGIKPYWWFCYHKNHPTPPISGSINHKKSLWHTHHKFLSIQINHACRHFFTQLMQFLVFPALFPFTIFCLWSPSFLTLPKQVRLPNEVNNSQCKTVKIILLLTPLNNLYFVVLFFFFLQASIYCYKRP